MSNRHAIAAILFIVIGLAGCAGSQPVQPDTLSNHTLVGLPPLPSVPLRQADAVVTYSRLGSEAFDYSPSPGAEVDGDNLNLTADPAELSFGIWEFTGIDSQVLTTADITVNLAAGNSFYVGLANFLRDRWELSGPFTGNAQAPFRPGVVYNSDSNTLYVAVIAWDDSSLAVEQVTIGYEDSPSLYSVRGTVTDSAGEPLAGILVNTLPSEPLGPKYITDELGMYEIPNIPPSVLVVSPEAALFTYTPESIEVWIVNEDVTGVDFQADATGSDRYSITGTIEDDSAQPVQGVHVVISPLGIAVQSNASGEYSFNYLPNGVYGLTPTKPDFLFTPANREVTIADASQAGQDFVATNTTPPTFTISGTIQDDGSLPLPNVTVEIEPGGNTTLTDSNGDYAVAELTPDTYTVRPALSNHTFNPVSRDVVLTDSDAMGQDFTGTFGVPTYEGDIKTYLNDCAQCHFPAGLGNSLPLHDYASASTNAQTAWEFIETDPSHWFALPWDQGIKDTFKAWLDAGTPEN